MNMNNREDKKDELDEEIEEKAPDKENTTKLDDSDNKVEEKLGFFQRLKTDKKFAAKVELSGYGILILFIIVFANFSSTSGSSYNYNESSIPSVEDINLYKEIDDSYKASIDVTTIKDGVTSNREYEISNDSLDNSEIIVKIIDGNGVKYKLADTGEFYTDDNQLVEEKEVFDLISYRYLDFSSIKKYINTGTVDYTTKYSSGIELTSYKIMVRDILLDNTLDGYITINVTSEQDKVTMEIDYTDLLKSDTIDSCNVKIVYTDINSGDVPLE